MACALYAYCNGVNETTGSNPFHQTEMWLLWPDDTGHYKVVDIVLSMKGNQICIALPLHDLLGENGQLIQRVHIRFTLLCILSLGP